jgi:hypothetical protein
VHDDFSAGDLRRVRECLLKVLLAHPVGRDAGRLVGLSLGVEEADRAEDDVAGIDQLIAAEAWQLAQPGKEAVLSLLD